MDQNFIFCASNLLNAISDYNFKTNVINSSSTTILLEEGAKIHLSSVANKNIIKIAIPDCFLSAHKLSMHRSE